MVNSLDVESHDQSLGKPAQTNQTASNPQPKLEFRDLKQLEQAALVELRDNGPASDPLRHQPVRVLAARLKCSERLVLQVLERLRDQGKIVVERANDRQHTIRLSDSFDSSELPASIRKLKKAQLVAPEVHITAPNDIKVVPMSRGLARLEQVSARTVDRLRAIALTLECMDDQTWYSPSAADISATLDPELSIASTGVISSELKIACECGIMQQLVSGRRRRWLKVTPTGVAWAHDA